MKVSPEWLCLGHQEFDSSVCMGMGMEVEAVEGGGVGCSPMPVPSSVAAGSTTVSVGQDRQTTLIIINNNTQFTHPSFVKFFQNICNIKSTYFGENPKNGFTS